MHIRSSPRMSDHTPKSPGSPSASKAVLALKANFLQEIVEFLETNNTLKFLTEIPKIHQSQELRNGRGPPDLKIEKEIVDLLTKPGAEKLQTKFTVACLTAIKGSFYKPNGRAALNSLLHSAKLFGNRTGFSQKIDRVSARHRCMQAVAVGHLFVCSFRISFLSLGIIC